MWNESDEVRKAIVPRNLGEPTQQMKEEHEATHLPYRSWHKACFMGKRKDAIHFTTKSKEERTVTDFVFDYCFMCDKCEETVTVIVARCI